MILVALTLIAFRRVVTDVVATAMHEPEALHLWLAPLLIACILWRRRDSIRASAQGGAMSGLILVAASLAALGLSAWAWFPEYASRAAIVPALAGAVAVAAGWRTVVICLPALALALLMIPPGSPYLPFFVFRDDAYAPTLVQQALAAIPGGHGDFHVANFLAARTSEAMLLFGMLSMAVFAAACRPRSRGALIALTLLALPIAALCHLIRTLAWGLLENRGWSGEGWLSARAATVAAGLLLALALFFLIARIMRIMPAETAADARPGENA